MLPLFGALSDQIGRKPVYIAEALIQAVFAFCFFGLLDVGNTTSLWLP